MHEPIRSVLVLGAGVLGLATAARLSTEGFAVTVLDPSPETNGASAVAAGMISPGFEAALGARADVEAHAPVHRAAWEAWPAFADRFGVSLRRDGALWRGPEEDLPTRFAAAGFLLQPTSDGLFAPDEGRVKPLAALAELRRAIVAAGGRIIAGRALSVRSAEGRGAVETVDGRLEADRVVVACGFTAARLGGPLAPLFARVRPIKGQIVVLRPIQSVPDRVVRGPGLYVVPRSEGTVAVGATMQPGQADLKVEPGVVAGLRAAGVDLVPELKGAEIVRGEAGVRGASPDGLPMAGAVAPGVGAALAPRRNGWLLAPLVAEAVVASVKGETGSLAAARLDPLRFSRA